MIMDDKAMQLMDEKKPWKPKSGIDYLNTMLFETVKNYSPDLLVLGHSDNLSLETLDKIKKFKI